MPDYGLCTGFLAHLPRREALAKITGAGFARVELTANASDLDGWVSDPVAMRRHLAARDLCAASMHLPSSAWNTADPDPVTSRAASRAALDSFRVAAAVGARVVICHPNGPQRTYTADRFAENTKRSRDSLARLAEAARALGLRMAVENLPARHLPRPGSTVAQVLELIDGLGSHVGICLDAGHSTANGLNPADEARRAGEHLFALHIQDNDGSGEDQHLIPGDGITDWGAFRQTLNDIGFLGLRNFEVGLGKDIDASLARLATLRRSWMEE